MGDYDMDVGRAHCATTSEGEEIPTGILAEQRVI